MEAIDTSIDIAGPMDRVFAYLSNPERLTEWLPGMVAVRKSTGSGVGHRHEWTYRMLGSPLDGVATTIAHVPPSLHVTRTRGGIDSIWRFTLTPLGGGTHLALNVMYEVQLPLEGLALQRLVARLNEQELRLALENIRHSCER